MNRIFLACLTLCVLTCGASGQAATPNARTPGAQTTTTTQPAPTTTDAAEAARLNQSVVELFKAQKYTEALPLAERVLALREKASEPDDLKVGYALTNLAAIHQYTGKFDKAEPLTLRALSIYEKAWGVDSPRLVDTLTSLGVIRYRRGDTKKAVEYLQRVLAIKEKAFGADHIEMAPTWFAISEIYLVKGDYAKAEPALRRAIEIWKLKLEPDDPKLEKAFDRYTCLLAYSGQKFDPANSPSRVVTTDNLPTSGTLVGGVINGTAISKPAPAYPDRAKAERISGTVVVKITVDETGKVIKAAAICGHPLLAKASEEAAWKAQFTPTLLSGQTVKVTGTISYTFTLQ